MTEEEKSVRDLVKELIEQNKAIVERKETKPWKLPFKGRVNKAKIKRGFATIQLLKNNGEVDFLRAPVDADGTVEIDGFPRIATAEYKMSYKCKPFYIIPEWSMKPISLVETRDQTERERMDVAGRRLILSKLEKEQVDGKKKMKGGIGLWIVIGIAIIGLIWWVSKSGGKLF